MLATRDFHVSALSPDGVQIFGFWWVYFFGFPVYSVYYHITSFCFQELAEHFVPSSSRVKHARAKVWSSWPIMPNAPYYFFEKPEYRQQLSPFAQSSRGNIGKILFNALQWESLKKCQCLFCSFGVWHLFDHWSVRLQPRMLLSVLEQNAETLLVHAF